MEDKVELYSINDRIKKLYALLGGDRNLSLLCVYTPTLVAKEENAVTFSVSRITNWSGENSSVVFEILSLMAYQLSFQLFNGKDIRVEHQWYFLAHSS